VNPHGRDGLVYFALGRPTDGRSLRLGRTGPADSGLARVRRLARRATEHDRSRCDVTARRDVGSSRS
jgi:hypothetical protein